MIKPEKPGNEAERLAALHRYQVLDSEQDAAFDDLVAIAASICGVGQGMVSLVDADRQWFKSAMGIPRDSTPREESFCAHAILDEGSVLVVPDATQDERFIGNPLVEGPEGIRFYAGAPLLSGEGYPIGTLCVFDRVPQRIGPVQIEALKALSRQVTHLLELRRANTELSLHIRERQWYEDNLQRYHEALEVQIRDLSEQTRTDPLTELPNRRAFTAALETAIGKSSAGGLPLAVAVLDIDHFKLVNDLHGHAEGDKVLVELASLLRAQFSGGGMAARYGGEEFVMLFPGATLQQASLQCEFLREAISVLPVGVPVTVSIGVAQLRPRCDDTASVLKRADDALYTAKQGGRNRVSPGD